MFDPWSTRSRTTMRSHVGGEPNLQRFGEDVHPVVGSAHTGHLGISCVDPLTEGMVILTILNEVCLRKIYPITTV